MLLHSFSKRAHRQAWCAYVLSQGPPALLCRFSPDDDVSFPISWGRRSAKHLRRVGRVCQLINVSPLHELTRREWNDAAEDGVYGEEAAELRLTQVHSFHFRLQGGEASTLTFDSLRSAL